MLVEPLAGDVKSDGGHLRVYVEDLDNVHKVLDAAQGKATLVSVVPRKQTLEDLFVEIIREARK